MKGQINKHLDILSKQREDSKSEVQIDMLCRYYWGNRKAYKGLLWKLTGQTTKHKINEQIPRNTHEEIENVNRWIICIDTEPMTKILSKKSTGFGYYIGELYHLNNWYQLLSNFKKL